MIPPAEQWQTGVKNVPRAGQVRRRPRPADRPGAGAVQAVAGQQRRQHGALHRRREPPRRAGQHRRLAPGAVEHQAGGAAPAEGQGDPRPPQRLRRQGARRPAAGPRRRELRAVPARDQGPGHRRRGQHRAGVFAGAGQDRRLGARGVPGEPTS